MMQRFILMILFLLLIGACSKKNEVNTAMPVSPAPPAANGQPVMLTVNENQPGFVISDNFEGISYEVGILPKLPVFLNANNAVLIQLIKNLGSGILRIGGNSSDQTYWTGKARNSSTGTDSLTTTDMDTFSAFAKATGWPVLFGLNLGNYNTSIAANEAGYVSSSLGSNLYALQIGNEPDLYAENGHRTSSYAYTNYQGEWDNYFSAIRLKLSQVPVAGPDVADNTKWVSSFADAEHTNVKLIDGHYYNSGPASSAAITYQTLLAPNTKLPVYLQALLSASSKYQLPYRISECNSVYDGGKSGVSDVFAATLWALDFMWQVAENGGQGIDFHGGNSGAYTPIALDNNVITARPEYYAMLTFKYGGSGGTIVPATLSQTTSYNCSAYACTGGGATRITLINKDAIALSYHIQLNNTASAIQISRLTAPAITSTTGITLAGASTGPDGLYKPVTTENYSINGKSFIINVPAASAVIVTVKY